MTETTDTTIKAMEILKNDIVCAIDACNKTTLKAAKSVLATDVPNLPSSFTTQVKESNNVRTKKEYVKQLTLIDEGLTHSIKVAQDAKIKDGSCSGVQEHSNMIKDESVNESVDKPKNIYEEVAIEMVKESTKETTKETTETKTKGDTDMPSKVAEKKTIKLDTDKLAQIAEDVRNEIETATKAHFKAGKLLSDALDMFKAAGKPAKEWIEWAGLQCSVKKAQAYNLVKIYNTFGIDSEFSNCSMRVLNNLVHLDSKLFGKIEEEAKELAKDDKLTTKRVNQLIDTVKPVKANTKPTEKVEDKGKDKTGEAIGKELKADTDTKADTKGDTDTKVNKEIAKQEDLELKKLREENEALKAQLAEMNEILKKLESKANSKPASIVPVLPQFSSDCPATVLGVKLGAGPAEINSHFRTMAKIFHASTCPEGAKALKAAREELLKSKKTS